MKIIKMEQNSEEWLEYRKGKSGGSEFKDLYMPAYEKDPAVVFNPEKRKERYYEIIAERVARPVTPNDYADRLNGQPFSMMARGHILEDEALEAFEVKTGKKVDKEDQVWVSDYDPDAYISPDGTITDEDGKIREAVEVKCLSSAKIVRAFIEQKYPQEYEKQAIKYFMVNEDLQVLHFVLYTDLIPGLEIQIFDIKREDIENKITQLIIFEKQMLELVRNDVAKIEELSF